MAGTAQEGLRLQGGGMSVWHVTPGRHLVGVWRRGKEREEEAAAEEEEEEKRACW